MSSETSFTDPKGLYKWRSLRLALSNLPRAFILVWQTNKLLTIVLSIITALSAFAPLAQAWIAKIIIDTVVASSSLFDVQVFLEIVPLILLELAVVGLNLIFIECSSLIQRTLSTDLRYRVSLEIINKSIALDIQYFESPEYYDQLQNARNEAGWRSVQLVRTAFEFIQHLITILTFLTALVAFSLFIALLLLVATFPAFVFRIIHSSNYYVFQVSRTPASRKMNYLEHLLTTDYSAKEVRLFNLGGFLLERYKSIFIDYAREDKRLARQRAVAGIIWGLVATASYYSAYAWIILETLQNHITLGEMTFYILLCSQAQGLFQAILFDINEIYEGGLFLENLYSFLKIESTTKLKGGTKLLPRPIKNGITFENVSFCYLGRSDWAIRDLNFHINPGEKIALVGENGAGKTTIIKLLSRLYEPTEGRILIDGVELKDYDLVDLRLRIGIIFQDFVRYFTTLRENIGFGDTDKLSDEAEIVSTAIASGANDVALTLPQGYDTVLGHWFEGGTQISGGQWQKVALSRAFIRDSDILILDEPTASLDASHEHEIFQKFHELTTGKTSILISHRFNTVRAVDRILVLKHGTIVECGNHTELMLKNGLYAHLFSLQAQKYS